MAHLTSKFTSTIPPAGLAYFYLPIFLVHPSLPLRLSSLPTYYIPKDGSIQSYRDYINQLPNVDHPEAFGQHTNADIASQIKETR